MSNLLGTYRGQMLDLLDPKPHMIDIESIAWGLAGVNRFAGQAHTRYTVAEHSILVSYLVEPALAKAALLHDAAEAYLGDVPTPLKSLLPDYRRIYRRVEFAVHAKFLVHTYSVHHPAIKEADELALKMERVCHTHQGWDWGDGGVECNLAPRCYDDPYAAFLKRWEAVKDVN